MSRHLYCQRANACKFNGFSRWISFNTTVDHITRMSIYPQRVPASRSSFHISWSLVSSPSSSTSVLPPWNDSSPLRSTSTSTSLYRHRYVSSFCDLHLTHFHRSISPSLSSCVPVLYSLRSYHTLHNIARKNHQRRKENSADMKNNALERKEDMVPFSPSTPVGENDNTVKVKGDPAVIPIRRKRTFRDKLNLFLTFLSSSTRRKFIEEVMLTETPLTRALQQREMMKLGKEEKRWYYYFMPYNSSMRDMNALILCEKIVEHANHPDWGKCNMATGYAGWTRLLFIHLWLVESRLRSVLDNSKTHVMDRLTRYLWEDLETGLYQTLDSRNPMILSKYSKLFAQVWFGMALALDYGTITSDASLSEAVWRNMYDAHPHVPMNELSLWVHYIRRSLQYLSSLSDHEVMNADFEFLPPPFMSTTALTSTTTDIDEMRAMKQPSRNDRMLWLMAQKSMKELRKITSLSAKELKAFDKLMGVEFSRIYGLSDPQVTRLLKVQLPLMDAILRLERDMIWKLMHLPKGPFETLFPRKGSPEEVEAAVGEIASLPSLSEEGLVEKCGVPTGFFDKVPAPLEVPEVVMKKSTRDVYALNLQNMRIAQNPTPLQDPRSDADPTTDYSTIPLSDDGTCPPLAKPQISYNPHPV